MRMKTVRIEINILKSTRFFQINCRHFVTNLKDILRINQCGKIIASQVTPSGLLVEIKIDSLMRIIPYLGSFARCYHWAGEKFTLWVHVSRRKYEITGEDSDHSYQIPSITPLKKKKIADPASERCFHGKRDSAIETISEIKKRKAKESNKGRPDYKAIVERQFGKLKLPVVKPPSLGKSLRLSAITDSLDEIIQPEDQPFEQQPDLTFHLPHSRFDSTRLRSRKLPLIKEKKWLH